MANKCMMAQNVNSVQSNVNKRTFLSCFVADLRWATVRLRRRGSAQTCTAAVVWRWAVSRARHRRKWTPPWPRTGVTRRYVSLVDGSSSPARVVQAIDPSALKLISFIYISRCEWRKWVETRFNCKSVLYETGILFQTKSYHLHVIVYIYYACVMLL